MRGGKGWPLAVILAHTEPELSLAMDDEFEKPRPPAGSITFATEADRRAYRTWRKARRQWDRYQDAVGDWG